MTDPVTYSWPALGTTATVAVSGRGIDLAVGEVRAEVEAIDLACSRFRPDSELSAVNSVAGRPVAVSELFLEALDAALRAARLTGGLVDPTIGRALRVLGYDRDFAAVDAQGPPLQVRFQPAPGWTAVAVDRTRRMVTVPAGVELDFGATAKALCADRAARRAAAATGSAVLVSLGGDIAVAGEPPGDGWPIGITDDHADPLGASGCTVTVRSGGLATSSTTVRRWRRGDRDLHHLIDPRSGQPADTCWRTVSVAAGSCLDANIAASAAVLMGPAAPAWLTDRHLPARLVGPDGQVVTVSGWVADREPAAR
ncbi:MAG TPA: FAD:protein FMN transferase [Acidimicrobiales bacterium]|nr:FAD:protein FMN transferase [Acidimicrobiales bacterium]